MPRHEPRRQRTTTTCLHGSLCTHNLRNESSKELINCSAQQLCRGITVKPKVRDVASFACSVGRSSGKGLHPRATLLKQCAAEQGVPTRPGGQSLLSEQIHYKHGILGLGSGYPSDGPCACSSPCDSRVVGEGQRQVRTADPATPAARPHHVGALTCPQSLKNLK